MTDPNLSLLDRIIELSETLSSVGRPDLFRDVYPGLYKSAIVGVGSFLEMQFMSLIEDCARAKSSSTWVGDFIRSKGLKRQYHTLFDWDKMKAGPLVGFFGMDFKSTYTRAMRETGNEQSERAFLELGFERNLIAHTYWSTNPQKTPEELKDAYLLAREYPELVRRLLLHPDFSYVETDRFGS